MSEKLILCNQILNDLDEEEYQIYSNKNNKFDIVSENNNLCSNTSSTSSILSSASSYLSSSSSSCNNNQIKNNLIDKLASNQSETTTTTSINTSSNSLTHISPTYNNCNYSTNQFEENNSYLRSQSIIDLKKQKKAQLIDTCNQITKLVFK